MFTSGAQITLFWILYSTVFILTSLSVIDLLFQDLVLRQSESGLLRKKMRGSPRTFS